MEGPIGEALLLMLVAAALGAIIAWTVLQDRMAKQAADAKADGPTTDPKLKAELAKVKKEHEACQKARTELRQKSEETIRDLEAKLQKAKAELAQAREQVPTDPAVAVRAATTQTATKPKAKAEAKPQSKTAKEEEALARVKQRAAELDFGRIGTATANEKDDLKEVKGIGPFIEKKLNALGIYTFRQIANFDEDLEDKVNDAIEFFPGRIRRDDWKGQAAELAKKNQA